MGKFFAAEFQACRSASFERTSYSSSGYRCDLIYVDLLSFSCCFYRHKILLCSKADILHVLEHVTLLPMPLPRVCRADPRTSTQQKMHC